MSNKLEVFKESIQNKKIAVLGLGISNRPLIKYLSGIGVSDLTGFDGAKENSSAAVAIKEDLKGYLKEIHLGENYLEKLLDDKYDYIFKTPVIRHDIPELLRAKEQGAIITSEMEVFMQLCPATIVAITGSDGKTTTSTLVYEILKEEGYKTWLGGNIGNPLLKDIEEIKETDMVVLELSSFQLHTMTASPHVAVVTNVLPNHLDVHKSYAEYIDAKSNIFARQNAAAGDFAVLNLDYVVTAEYAKKVPGAFRFFSRKQVLDKGTYINGGYIVYKKYEKDEEIKITKISDILLPGKHNVENYMAASCAVIDYVKPETINKVAKRFKGVEHRLEFVREFEGVKYYNGSIDTSPSRTNAALKTFGEKIILIAGGKDKGISYDEIGSPILDKVKILILIGPTSKNIEEAINNEVLKRKINRETLNSQLEIIRCTSYEEVVDTARSKSQKGDCVLLSPASTSFDMFKNFEERGNTFKKLVNELK